MMEIKVNLDASPKLVECITGLTAAIQTLAGKKTEKSESEIARELLRTGGKVKSEPAKLDETTPITRLPPPLAPSLRRKGITRIRKIRS